MKRGGEEHRLTPPDLAIRNWVLKATYPGRYGFTVVAGPVYPGLAAALPSEYLTRLELGNRVFGDDWRLEAVGVEGGKLVVFTSQTTVIGEAATSAEIIAFMQRRRLMLLDGMAIGHPAALSFYRDLDQLAVFDAHPANVLKDESGVLLPIDLIMLTAEGALAEQLEMALA